MTWSPVMVVLPTNALIFDILYNLITSFSYSDATFDPASYLGVAYERTVNGPEGKAWFMR